MTEKTLKKIEKYNASDKDKLQTILSSFIDFSSTSGGMISTKQFDKLSDAIIDFYNLKMIDFTDSPIQIQISQDGKTVWVNSDKGCLLRAQKITELHIEDMRRMNLYGTDKSIQAKPRPTKVSEERSKKSDKK